MESDAVVFQRSRLGRDIRLAVDMLAHDADGLRAQVDVIEYRVPKRKPTLVRASQVLLVNSWQRGVLRTQRGPTSWPPMSR